MRAACAASLRRTSASANSASSVLQVRHQPFDALLHRARDAHAHHVRHRPQQAGRAPAAQHHVAALGQREEFLGRVERKAALVGR
jgi:hypothetical protein